MNHADQKHMSRRARRIREAMERAFKPDSLEVEDESWKHAGHAGARERGGGHFLVHIVAACFSGQPRLVRHSMVHEALGDAFRGDIHALSIRAQSPDEASDLRLCGDQ